MKHKDVCILLSTFNGSLYLKEQIDSLFSQTYPCIKILARDDASRDTSLALLENNAIELVNSSSNLGAKKSFESLLSHAISDTRSEYFMFCDQDDVWKNDKVEKSVERMRELEQCYGNIPLMVHSDLSVVNASMEMVHSSFWGYQKISPQKNRLQHLLMQNTATGCTMMINRKLAELALPVGQDAIMHDWWITLVACCFGKIGILNERTMYYRQHHTNEIGATHFNVSYVLHKIFQSTPFLQANLLQACDFYEQYKNHFDEEHRMILEAFMGMPHQSFIGKRYTLFKYGFFKYGFLRNLGLLIRI